MSESLRFGYSRSLAPMMWVSAVNLVVVHFRIAIWSDSAALVPR